MAKYCVNCGSPVEEGARFCENCGAKLDEQAAPEWQAPAARPDGQARQEAAAQPTQQQPVQQQPAASQPAPQSPQQQAYQQPQEAAQTPQYQQGQGPQTAQTFQQYPQPTWQPQKKKSRAGVVIGIIAGIAVLIAAVLVLLFVAPGFLRTPNTPPLDPPILASEAEPTDAPSSSLPEETDSAPSSAAEAEPSAEPAEAPGSSPDFSQVGRPEIEEFDWVDPMFFDDDYVPDITEVLTTGEQISGRWKAVIKYVDDSFEEVIVTELVNVEIQAGDRAVTVTIDPYRIDYDGYFEDETDMEDWSYSGALDDGEIYAFSEYGDLSIEGFYVADGKQYGIAVLTTQDGTEAYMGLVRP